MKKGDLFTCLNCGGHLPPRHADDWCDVCNNAFTTWLVKTVLWAIVCLTALVILIVYIAIMLRVSL